MKVDETNIVKAQRMGYRVIDENGRRCEQNPTLLRPQAIASELALVGGSILPVQPIHPERDRVRPPVTR